MMRYYIFYLIALSFVTFVLYGCDKDYARRGKWRIPERVLLGASLFGGAPGGLLGMQVFRHKTKHVYFYILNAVGIFLHAAILFLMIKYL